MCASKLVVLLALVAVAVSFSFSSACAEDVPPLFQLTVKSDKEEYQVGEDIEVTFVIENMSDRAISLTGLSLRPNPQNWEAFNCDLFGKRNGVTFAFSKPKSIIPDSVSGPRRWRIPAGGSLTVVQLFSKWETHEGLPVSQLPGTYELEGKMTNLSLDSYTKLTVFSRNKIAIRVREVTD